MSLFAPAGLPPTPFRNTAGARTMGRAAGRADGLSPAQQRAVVAAIVVLHVGLGYGLLQVQAVREAVVEAAPIFVDLLTPAPPAPPVPVPVPPPPVPQRVAQKKPPPPAPVITTAPSPAPAAFTAPSPPPVVEPLPPIAPPAPPAELAIQAPSPAPAAVTPPKMIPPSAVQYLEPVTPAYSQASARAREHGRVVARFFIDEAGMPRDVGVSQSSGYVRLDESWVAALRKTRFKPPTLNGQPISGWALAAFDFQL